jgi:hypothetical protein
VPGGVDPDGDLVAKPGELIEAEIIIDLCERFHCLPSALLAEDAQLFRWLRILQLGGSDERMTSGYDDEG